jgi:hypothetical protein
MISVILYVVLYLLIGTVTAFVYMVLAAINGMKVDGSTEYCPASLLLLIYPIVLVVYLTERFCNFLDPLRLRDCRKLKEVDYNFH